MRSAVSAGVHRITLPNTSKPSITPVCRSGLRAGSISSFSMNSGDPPGRAAQPGQVGAGDVEGVGGGTVGERGPRHARHHVVARRTTTILDVRGELLVEELERLVLQILGQVGEPVGEQPVIGLGNAFQVGDHQQRERRRVGADEFTATLDRTLAKVLAYNLGNFLRRLALPKPVRHWSMTTLREKLIKIGALLPMMFVSGLMGPYMSPIPINASMGMQVTERL